MLFVVCFGEKSEDVLLWKSTLIMFAKNFCSEAALWQERGNSDFAGQYA
jgi:hypothetical protein